MDLVGGGGGCQFVCSPRAAPQESWGQLDIFVMVISLISPLPPQPHSCQRTAERFVEIISDPTIQTQPTHRSRLHTGQWAMTMSCKWPNLSIILMLSSSYPSPVLSAVSVLCCKTCAALWSVLAWRRGVSTATEELNCYILWSSKR